MNFANSVRSENRQPYSLLATRGGLDVRLAMSAQEIAACQKLRYKVFHEELKAKPDTVALAVGMDLDGFDEICDHLLVSDGGEVVGTYRLLRQDVAEARHGFYTQGEFDIAPLLEAHCEFRFIELGRSCVLKPWRTKPVVELLWQGIWNYVRLNSFDVMFGCASLEGTDTGALSQALSYLHHNHLADQNWRARAHQEQFVEMNIIPASEIDMRAAFKSLPPLIKGYLRLGARVGSGAVVDYQFNTTDVFIILPVAHINPRYFEYFGAPDEMAGKGKPQVLKCI
ncbi:MAG: GNAT family N-acetyltransferase [Hyphomicrobiales bacterium]